MNHSSAASFSSNEDTLIRNWAFEKVLDSVYVLKRGKRFLNASTMDEYGPVEDVMTGERDTIKFKFESSETRKSFNWCMFDNMSNEFSQLFSGVATKKDFIQILIDNSKVTKVSKRAPKRKTCQADDGITIGASDRTPDVHLELESFKIGTYEVSFDTLKTPEKKHQTRDICFRHVKSLQRKLMAAPGTVPTKFAVVSMEDNVQNGYFNMRSLAVAGGRHLYESMKGLRRENQEQPERVSFLSTVTADVFSNRLSDTQFRQLSNVHNEKMKTILGVSPMDRAKQARRLLYERTGKCLDTDEPPAKEEIPESYRTDFAVEIAMLSDDNNKRKGSVDCFSLEFFLAKLNRRNWELLWNLYIERLEGRVKEEPINSTSLRKLMGLDQDSIYYLLCLVNKAGDFKTFRNVAEMADLFKRLPALKQCAEQIKKTDWLVLESGHKEELATPKLLEYAKDFKVLRSGQKLPANFNPPERFKHFILSLDRDVQLAPLPYNSSRVKFGPIMIDGKKIDENLKFKLEEVMLKFLNGEQSELSTSGEDAFHTTSTPRRQKFRVTLPFETDQSTIQEQTLWSQSGDAVLSRGLEGDECRLNEGT